MRFTFLPPDCYQKDFCITPAHILHFMERKFFTILSDAIQRKIRELAKTGYACTLTPLVSYVTVLLLDF